MGGLQFQETWNTKMRKIHNHRIWWSALLWRPSATCLVWCDSLSGKPLMNREEVIAFVQASYVVFGSISMSG